MSPFRGRRSTSLRHDDDGVDVGPSSRLGNGYCIDDARDSLINRPIMLSVLSEVRPAEVRPAEVRTDVATPRVPGLHALGRGRSAAPVNPPRPGSDEQMFGAD